MCAMGLPAAAAAVDLERTNARTRRILASAVRVTALMLHAEAFPQAFLQCSRRLRRTAQPFADSSLPRIESESLWNLDFYL